MKSYGTGKFPPGLDRGLHPEFCLCYGVLILRLLRFQVVLNIVQGLWFSKAAGIGLSFATTSVNEDSVKFIVNTLEKLILLVQMEPLWAREVTEPTLDIPIHTLSQVFWGKGFRPVTSPLLCRLDLHNTGKECRGE